MIRPKTCNPPRVGVVVAKAKAKAEAGDVGERKEGVEVEAEAAGKAKDGGLDRHRLMKNSQKGPKDKFTSPRISCQLTTRDPAIEVSSKRRLIASIPT